MLEGLVEFFGTVYVIGVVVSWIDDDDSSVMEGFIWPVIVYMRAKARFGSKQDDNKE